MSANTFECEACGGEFPVTTDEEDYPDVCCDDCADKLIAKLEGTAIGDLLMVILGKKETVQ